MIFISKMEKVPVKEVPSLQLLLLRIPHPRVMLQQLSQLERLSIVIHVKQKRRILPLRKSRVHISSL
jgi:hypothetical protein